MPRLTAESTVLLSNEHMPDSIKSSIKFIELYKVHNQIMIILPLKYQKQ